jgi:serine protease Do
MMTKTITKARRWTMWGAAALIAVNVAAVSPPARSQDQAMPSIANTVERLLPAVVEITTSQKVAQAEGGPTTDLPPNAPFRDFFEDFFKNRRNSPGPEQQAPQASSLGSGFVIDASGYIITNNHVIEQAETIEVRFTDGTKLKAELKGRDPKTDIALLQVKPAKPLAAVQFGDSDVLRVGDWVMAIGNPFGLGGSVSLGIVSARNRDINAGPYDDYIQTDAAINKGNSGGPLFNLKGDVVGINTAIYSPSGGSVGIGFSVPAATAKGVVNQLIKYGETRRGWIGVKIQPVTDDLIESLKMDSARGALVADVTAGGPAEKSGLQAGDVIVEFDGRPVREMKHLPRIVAETEIGRSVVVKAMRQGKELTVNAEVGRLEDGEKLVAGGGAAVGESVKVLGMTIAPLTDDLRGKFTIDAAMKGAVVTEVEAASPAADKSITPGDVITEAGEKAVTSPGDVQARVKDAEKAGKNSVLLLVSKGGKQGEMSFIAVKLK